jgi:hypothetical protein
VKGLAYGAIASMVAEIGESPACDPRGFSPSHDDVHACARVCVCVCVALLGRACCLHRPHRGRDGLDNGCSTGVSVSVCCACVYSWVSSMVRMCAAALLPTQTCKGWADRRTDSSWASYACRVQRVSQMGAVSDVDRGMRFDLQDRTRMHTGHVLHSIVLKGPTLALTPPPRCPPSTTPQLATMPVDVVKVRMQFAGADGAKVYDGISDCIMKTAKVEPLTLAHSLAPSPSLPRPPLPHDDRCLPWEIWSSHRLAWADAG